MDLLDAPDHGECLSGVHVLLTTAEAGDGQLERKAEEDRLGWLGFGCDGYGVSVGKWNVVTATVEC